MDTNTEIYTEYLSRFLWDEGTGLGRRGLISFDVWMYDSTANSAC